MNRGDNILQGLDRINEEKNLKVLSENIKKGVSMFGVLGTLTGEGGGVKIYPTIEEMNKDETLVVGDLSLVYDNNFSSVGLYDTFTSLCVMDEFTIDFDIVYGYISYNISSSYSVFGTIGVSSREISVNVNVDGTYYYSAYYSSTDGRTFKRNDKSIVEKGGYDTWDFGVECYFNGYDDTKTVERIIPEMFRNQKNTFLGLFEKDGAPTEKPEYAFASISPSQDDVGKCVIDSEYGIYSSSDWGMSASNLYYQIERYFSRYGVYYAPKNIILVDTYYINKFPNPKEQYYAYVVGATDECAAYMYNLKFRYDFGTLAIFGGYQDFSGVETIYKKLLISNSEFGGVNIVEDITTDLNLEFPDYDEREGVILNLEKIYTEEKFVVGYPTTEEYSQYFETSVIYTSSDYETFEIPFIVPEIGEKNKYAKTQLTATKEDVYGTIFYGKNGVERGSLQETDVTSLDGLKRKCEVYSALRDIQLSDELTNLSYAFQNSTITTIPSFYVSSSVLNATGMFDGCSYLKEVPNMALPMFPMMFHNCYNLRSLNQVDFTNSIQTKSNSIAAMFQGCSNLMELPQLNTNYVTNFYCAFDNCRKINTIPNYNLHSAENISYTFRNCVNLTDISNINIANSQYAMRTFENCFNLTRIENLELNNLISIRYMFCNCRNLEYISFNNMLKVQDAAELFSGCNKLESIINFNPTSNLSNMSYMFSRCSNLKEAPFFNTNGVNQASTVFESCINLTIVPEYNFSQVNYAYALFRNCYNLTEIPNYNFKNLSSAESMFANCNNITSIPNFYFSKLNSLGSAFVNCKKLTAIPNFNTGLVINFSNTFYGCELLTTIPNFNTTKLNNLSNAFYNCKNLVDFPELYSLNINNMRYAFNNCSKLSNSSLNNILTMCSKSKVTSYKTLKNIGLTSTQANICKDLPAYSAFTSAGWSTGY